MGPVEYAKQARSANDRAQVKTFIAFLVIISLAGFPWAGRPGAPFEWPMVILAKIVPFSLFKLLVFVGHILEAAAWPVFTLLQVGFIRMCMRLRAGEDVEAGDGLRVQDVLVPGLAIGLPMAAAHLLSVLSFIWSGFNGIAQALASLAMLAFMWAPYEIALGKTTDPKQACMNSLEFWKTNPVGHLIFVVVAGLASIANGFVIFAFPIYTLAYLAYYTDQKAGVAAVAAAAPAPALAAPAPAAPAAAPPAPAAPGASPR